MDSQQALENYFGFREFREPQGEVVSEILSGSDVSVVMPTGAGKSLCYQLPAVLLDGVTVVVSPLIALMKDQVEQLHAKRVSAAFLNSTLAEAQRIECKNRLRDGEPKLLYVAPERLRSEAL